MRTSPPTTRRRMPRAQREAQILTVAEQVFAELGYQATTMDEIAERVGVTKPLIYDYFGSKDGLLVACVDKARTELADVTETAIRGLPRDTSLEEVLRAGIGAFFTFVDGHVLGFRVLYTETAAAAGAGADIERIRAQQSAVVVDALRRLSRLASVPSVQLEGFAEVVIGACERIAVWRSHRDDVSAEAATAVVMSVVWQGLSSLAP